MSDDEDDYLSDKFLIPEPSASSAPKTYSQRRKEQERISALRNEHNRRKSRKQLEEESREAGLSKSLFERAEEESSDLGTQNKALAMMMKMGFKPGQSLGQNESQKPSFAPPKKTTPPVVDEDEDGKESSSTANGQNTPSHSEEQSKPNTRHLVAPLPLNEWSGRTGIGVRKRAASPSAAERLAKMAKMAEEHDHASFRDRARQEYQERQAEGRLGPAQRTCATLDEKAGRKFNVLCLNPEDLDTFPEGLIDLLEDGVLSRHLDKLRYQGTVEGRLRAKMQADALQPIKPGSELEIDTEESGPSKTAVRDVPYTENDLEECTAFLKLSAKDRLSLVLDYLRDKYYYCFWCGTQYEDPEDLGANCPGREEEAHD